MQQQPKAPTLQDIEQKYSQLPPQYRQAVLEKQQREHQQLLLQQQQQGQSQVQPQPQPQQRQTLRPEPGRNQSVSLSSSPNEGAKPGNNGAWSSTRQRISSAPLTSTYRSHRDNDSLSSVSSNTTGPGRAHWKSKLHALHFYESNIFSSQTAVPTFAPGQVAGSSLVSLTGGTIAEIQTQEHQLINQTLGIFLMDILAETIQEKVLVEKVNSFSKGLHRLLSHRAVLTDLASHCTDIVRQTTPATGNIAIKRQPSIGENQQARLFSFKENVIKTD
ncbi:hypothetical protein BGX26_005598 [Mortierella sp. AD094]|nr:hypothetical protein BGX26_005598 [Mortierella sp. AD094]